MLEIDSRRPHSKLKRSRACSSPDRAFGSGPKGSRFDSCQAHQHLTTKQVSGRHAPPGSWSQNGHGFRPGVRFAGLGLQPGEELAVLPVQALSSPLPHEGDYRFNLLIDGIHQVSVPFVANPPAAPTLPPGLPAT